MLSLIPTIAQEMLLFAACGMVVFGIDDLIIDCLWLWGQVRGRHSRPLICETSPKTRIAVFVPAWQEAEVIGLMLRRCLAIWGDQPFHIFVGSYPNDPETAAAVNALSSDKILTVTLRRNGPTTKADCLNGLWNALRSFEQFEKVHFDAVLLHDAEDHVHAREISLFATFCYDYDLIQIPVVPDMVPESRWVSGHYLDEFAEAHRKELIVRQALGASVPSAGTGCAISRRALDHIANQKDGLPFDESSLTEDYELGLHLWQEGFSSRFVRAFDPITRSEIVVRSCFPATIDSSVRQKTRWILGIALAGWDRTGWDRSGWTGRPVEHWMRWRDRRVILASILIFGGYGGLMLWLLSFALGIAEDHPPVLTALFNGTLLLLLWRLSFRAYFTTVQYGWREGVRSAPRLMTANIISVMAASRAVIGYLRLILTGKVHWDKTAHIFPAERETDRQ